MIKELGMKIKPLGARTWLKDTKLLLAREVVEKVKVELKVTELIKDLEVKEAEPKPSQRHAYT